MIIDGRHETTTINFNHIDQFVENEENGRLTLVYHIPAEPSRWNSMLKQSTIEGMEKRNDEFECAENELILKAFSGIRNKIVGTGGHEAFISQSAVQAAATEELKDDDDEDT